MDGDFLVHFIALVVGILIILFIKKKYRKFSMVEVTAMIVLYTVLVLLFTMPVINLIKKLIE